MRCKLLLQSSNRFQNQHSVSLKQSSHSQHLEYQLCNPLSPYSPQNASLSSFNNHSSVHAHIWVQSRAAELPEHKSRSHPLTVPAKLAMPTCCMNFSALQAKALRLPRPRSSPQHQLNDPNTGEGGEFKTRLQTASCSVAPTDATRDPSSISPAPNQAVMPMASSEASKTTIARPVAKMGVVA